MRQVTIALLATLAFGGGVMAAQADQPSEKPAASQPASKPAAPGATVEVTDLDTIKANVGKEMTVHGKVSGSFKPRSGSVIIINFEGVNREFVAIVEKDNIDAVNAGFDGDIANAVKDKTLTITGAIKLYKEKPEIVISKPEQVKIEPAGDAEKKDEPAENKEPEKKD